MAAMKNASGMAGKPPAVVAGEITKIEAVRRALASLGKSALPDAIREFVNKRYGLEMTRDHVSVCKTEIRRQASGKKRPSRPRRSARQTPAPKNPTPILKPTPAARPTDNGARAAVGPSRRRRKSATMKVQPKAPSAARTVAPKPQAHPVAAPSRPSNGKAGYQLADIQAVKALVARIGVAELRGLVDVLAR
jgi:hypothetical protein